MKKLFLIVPVFALSIAVFVKSNSQRVDYYPNLTKANIEALSSDSESGDSGGPKEGDLMCYIKHKNKIVFSCYYNEKSSCEESAFGYTGGCKFAEKKEN